MMNPSTIWCRETTGFERAYIKACVDWNP